MKKKMIIISSIGVLALLIASLFFSFTEDQTSHEENGATLTVWTCAMHPQIHMPSPGQCPICGMNLIPLKPKESSREGSSIKLSERARKLAEVETTPVKKGKARLEVPLYGKLELDESRIAHITARTSGRIEHLFLDFTGVFVRKGDHMVDLYSPDLITAQQELIQAQQAAKERTSSDFLREATLKNLESAREKLLLWGISKDQVDRIAKSGKLEEVISINAPMEGVVIHKEAVEGKYVKEGTKIYTIADLTQLWLVLDAYESDLAWLRHGQTVYFQAEALPGKTFEGEISFIDPILNETKRSARIRVNVNNQEGILKPGMFVRATAQPFISVTGEVISNSLAEAELPLLIPATAPLITGKQAVVYVEDPNLPGSYSARTIILGPRAGDYYIVYEGLKEGEQVVSSGNFKIDSASQILAQPSMMMPEGGAKPMKGHNH